MNRYFELGLKSQTFEPDECFRRKPPADILRPRRGHWLEFCGDIPFLARFLQQGDPKRYAVFNKRHRQFCFRTRREAQTFRKEHGIDGSVRVLTRKDAVEELMKEFWAFREVIASPYASCEIRIGDLILKDGTEVADQVLWDFGAGLRYPFFPDGDALLKKPSLIKYYQWASKRSEVLFCPLDGPIEKLLQGYYSSSSHSWKNRHGRLESFLLCLHCLGALFSKCHVMS